MPPLVIGVVNPVQSNKLQALVPKESGFTLFELLIVIVILGIVAAFALLATGDFGRSRRIEASVSQFVQLVQMAEQQAIIESNVLAIALTPHGYQFYRYQTTINNNQGQWQTLPPNSLLAYHSWPAGVKASVSSSNSSLDNDDGTKSFIIISPTGDLTPFFLYLKLHSKAIFYLKGLTNGTIEVKKL